jgi:hypothetical protein
MVNKQLRTLSHSMCGLVYICKSETFMVSNAQGICGLTFKETYPQKCVLRPDGRELLPNIEVINLFLDKWHM